MKKTVVLVIIFFLASCSHMKSGQYIQLQKGDNLKKLSMAFDMPAWAIQEANEGKPFSQGSWIFIPLKRGVVASNDSTVPKGIIPTIKGNREFIWPVPSSKNVTSPYGPRWGRMHSGIDISSARGNHIVASNNGVVVYSGNDYSGYGNLIVIAHDHGIFTMYAHNNKNYVRRGQKVYQGQVIAQIGNTGISTGSHLHFEVRRKGHHINPFIFVKR